MSDEKIFRRLDNIHKIIAWTVEMHKRGLMPPDVAQACAEYFGGEDENTVGDAETEFAELAKQF